MRNLNIRTEKNYGSQENKRKKKGRAMNWKETFMKKLIKSLLFRAGHEEWMREKQLANRAIVLYVEGRLGT